MRLWLYNSEVGRHSMESGEKNEKKEIVCSALFQRKIVYIIFLSGLKDCAKLGFSQKGTSLSVWCPSGPSQFMCKLP